MAVDFGRLFFTYIQVSNAAREAADYGAAQPTDSGWDAGARRPGEELADARRRPARPDRDGLPEPGGDRHRVYRRTGRCRLRQHADRDRPPAVPLPHSTDQRFPRIEPGDVVVGDDRRVRVSGGGHGAGARGRALPRPTPPSRSWRTGTTSSRTPTDPSRTLASARSPATTGTSVTATPPSARASPISHTYAASGTYAVNLEVTNQGGSLTAIRTVTVPPCHPDPHTDVGADTDAHDRAHADADDGTDTDAHRDAVPHSGRRLQLDGGQPAPERHLHRPVDGGRRLPDHDLALGLRRCHPVEQRARILPTHSPATRARGPSD